MSWLDVATLFIAGVSLLVSTTVAIVTWMRSREVIRVRGDIRPRILQPGARRPLRAGYAISSVTITCRNYGRTDATVHALLFVANKNGATIRTKRDERSDPIPVTVPARGQVTWFMPPRSWGVMTKQQGNPVIVRPVVSYGPGKKARGRTLRIAVPSSALPGAGQHFRPSLTWRVARLPTVPNRTRRWWRDWRERRRAAGQPQAVAPTIESKLTCVGCGAVLEDGLAEEPPDFRTPCAGCGSTERKVDQIVHAGTAEIKLDEW